MQKSKKITELKIKYLCPLKNERYTEDKTKYRLDVHRSLNLN